MRYRLEHRIHTLAEIGIDEHAFTVEDVTFSQRPADPKPEK